VCIIFTITLTVLCISTLNYLGSGKGGDVFFPAGSKGPESIVSNDSFETPSAACGGGDQVPDDDLEDYQVEIGTHVVQARAKFIDGPYHNFGFFPAPQGITNNEELNACCQFKFEDDGTVLRVISKAPSALTNKKGMLQAFQKQLAAKITDNPADQVACLVALTHMYQQLTENLKESNGNWVGVQNIPLLISKADKFDFPPEVLTTASGQVLIFFSVTPFEEYLKQLRAEAYEDMKESASKRQKVTKLDF